MLRGRSGKTECGWCDGDSYLNCYTCDGTGDIEQDDTYEISVDYFLVLMRKLNLNYQNSKDLMKLNQIKLKITEQIIKLS